MPTFTVIIPTYNRGKALRHCLESLVNQTFSDFETIVADDGSVDETKSIVEEYSNRLNLTYLYETNWGGPARPRNNAAKRASAEWLAFLDSDDWFYPNKLEEMAKVLHSGQFFYHGLETYRADYTKTGRLKMRTARKDVFKRLLCDGNFVPNSSVVVHRDLFWRAEGFSETKELIAVEDLDLWLKIARLTDNFGLVPLYLGGYYSGTDNLTEISERQIQRIKSIYAKHLEALPLRDRNLALGYLRYQEACMYSSQNKVVEARAHFLSTFWSPARFHIKLKAIFRLICQVFSHRRVV